MTKFVVRTPCSTINPRMYIPLDYVRRMKGIFENEKRPLLETLIGKNEASEIDFPVNDFSELLKAILSTADVNGLRVHFGTVGRLADPHYASEEFETLIPIFAPTRKNGQAVYADTGDYYVIVPRVGLLKVNTNVVITWVANYVPKWTVLSNAIEKDDSKSIWYEIEGVKELLDELHCLIAGHPVNWVTLFFSAFEPGTIKDGEDIGRQLNVIFFFYRKQEGSSDKEYVIFEERADPKKLLDGYDTGNPCPPNTCN